MTGPLPVAVHEIVDEVREHARVLRGEVAARDLVNGLLQLGLLLVVLAGVVAETHRARAFLLKRVFLWRPLVQA